MRRFLIIFSVLIAVGIRLGIDFYSLLGGLLLILIVAAGFMYMFTHKLVPQLLECFIILLFVPPLVLIAIYYVENFIRQLISGAPIDANPFPVFIILLLLMILAFIYVFRTRLRNRRVESQHLQGAEREPILPQTQFQRLENAISNDAEQI